MEMSLTRKIMYEAISDFVQISGGEIAPSENTDFFKY